MTAALVRWGRVPPVAARVNWGRWIADCPVCSSALAVRPGTPGFECWDCAALVDVVWPGADLQSGVERLLSMRPDPATRNWTTSETLDDLLEENLTHGAVPLDGATPGRLLEIAGDRIVVDNLPVLARAPRRLEIGA